MNNSVSTLLSLFRKLDFRDKKNSGRKKLIGILIAYLFSNTILAVNFYTFFDERSYVILTLTSNLFLFGMLVLNDFESLFLGVKNYEVLNTLPLKNSELFLAKFLSAAIFLMFFIVSASIPQVILFYFYENVVSKTILYFLTEVMFCYFAAGIILIFYSIILTYFSKRAGNLLNVFQVIFFIFIFYASTLSSGMKRQNGEGFQRQSIFEKDFVNYLPQTYFSGSVYSLSKMLLFLMLTAAVFVSLYFFLSKNYSRLIENTGTLKGKRNLKERKFNIGFIGKFTEKYLLKNNQEKASYNLVRSHLKNSRFLKTKYYPVAFIPLLMALVGLISGLPQLLFFNTNPDNELFLSSIMLIVSPSITMTLMISTKMLASNTKILDENTFSTEWIYDSLPVNRKEKIILGADKYIFINFILPVVIIIFLIISYSSDMQTAFANMLFVSSGLYFFNTVGSLFDKVYPFTLDNTKFNSASKFAEVFIAMISGIVLFFIQIFVFQNIIFVITSIVIFISVSYLINRN